MANVETAETQPCLYSGIPAPKTPTEIPQEGQAPHSKNIMEVFVLYEL